VFEYSDGAYNPVISNGQDLFLTGYKTLYDLRPATGPATNGIVQKPSAPPNQSASKNKKSGAKKKGK
jgi:hypothetical protein